MKEDFERHFYWQAGREFYIIKPRFLSDAALASCVSADGCEFSYLVADKSRLSAKRAVEDIAGCFRTELSYDFLNYTVSEHDRLGDCRPWLFVKRHCLGHIPFGACVFYKNTYLDVEADWVLALAWLHPYFRGMGFMTRALPIITRGYGRIFAVPPCSKAMKSVLDKVRDKVAIVD